MVEVFKTNVQRTELAKQMVSALNNHFPFFKVNFDLEDCDKILRVEGKEICTQTIVDLMRVKGIECEVLD